ncbi:MAG: DUF1759 domain-containing protein, partial [Gammaproteobacteria bacterium]|nr:DUF1759 domain-containing protein [Gammaproteobacteria bacterium]
MDSTTGHINLIFAGQDKISELKSYVEELEYFADTLRLAQNVSVSAPLQRGAQAATVPQAQQLQTAKLPKLELLKFNGDPVNWPAFWDNFTCNVVNQNISDSQKLAYLHSCVTGVAYPSISALATTDGNYHVAVNILKDRFGKDNVIKSSLISKLTGLKPANNNPKELRGTLDAMERALQQLEALNENVEQSVLVD